MNSIIKIFLDRISERILSLIGNSIGTTATTFHAASVAEQQSYLEDLARRYESEGKEDVAASLRQQASHLTRADGAQQGQEILTRVVGEKAATNLLTAKDDLADLVPGDSYPTKKRRATRARAGSPSSSDDSLS